MSVDADRERPTTRKEQATTKPDPIVELQRFVHGTLATSPLEGDWVPVAMQPFRDAARIRTPYPFFLMDGEEEGHSRGISWPDLLHRAASATDLGEGGRFLLDNLDRFERAVRESLENPYGEGNEAGAHLLDRIRSAGRASVDALGISDTPREQLLQAWDRLVDGLPLGSWVCLHESSALDVWRHCAVRAVRRDRGVLREEILEIVRRTRELLRLERLRNEGASDPGAVSAELGDEAESWFDPTRLAQVTGNRSGSVPRAPERVKAIETSLEFLEAYVEGEEGPEAAVVLSTGIDIPPSWDPEDKTQLTLHDDDPCARALDLFEREIEVWSALLRARKHLELELEGRFDPERHSAWLESAQPVLSRDARAFLPPIAAVLDATTSLARMHLSSLSEVLRGRLPIHVLVTVDPFEDPGAEESFGDRSRLELAYVAIGHRRAAAHQGVLSQPGSLMRAFDRLLDRPEPALHVIATSPLDGKPGPWLHLGAAVEGRAHPLFVFDPIAGRSWARRLELGDNPAPELAWPHHSLESGDEDFTFAHFALLDPRARAQFRLIPDDVDAADLVPLSEHLSNEGGTEAEVPFIRAIDSGGRTVRLAVSRPLVEATRDRMDYWHTLQELAGIDNEFVQRAVDRSRAGLEEEWNSERTQLAAEHARVVEEAKATAASEALEGVARFLLDLDPHATDSMRSLMSATADSGAESAAASEVHDVAGSGAPASAGPNATSGTGTGTGEGAGAGAGSADALNSRAEDTAEGVEANAAVPSEAEAQADAVAEVGNDDEEMDPYVDSPLCTSCNDCVQINPRLFVYDSNKQVEIKDPNAGTYAQLVQAAEKCPARCIHPGTPRDPNEPNLDELRRRAAPFN